MTHCLPQDQKAFDDFQRAALIAQILMSRVPTNMFYPHLNVLFKKP